MKEIKKSFRSTHGLDAANEHILNVKRPELSKDSIHYGINVEFFVDETTIQEYDPTRGYKKGFTISYKNKLFYSKFVIKAPAGEFSYPSWEQIRTDIQSKVVSSGTEINPYHLSPGQHISCDTTLNEVHFKLPDSPDDGDTIVISDIGGNLGLKKAQILAARHPIRLYGQSVSDFMLTRPYGTTVVTFVGNSWRVYQEQVAERAAYFSQSGTNQTQSGDLVYCESKKGSIKVTLPKYSNHGDIIKLHDLDGRDTTFNIILNVHPESKASIGKVGVKSTNLFTSGAHILYDSNGSTWKVFDIDHRERLKLVTSDYTLNPNDKITTFGPLNKERKTITLTLPESSDNGLPVYISNLYMRPGQKVVIKPADPLSVIMFNKDLMEFPKRSERITTGDVESLPEIVIDGSNDTYCSIELAYVDVPGKAPYWVVTEYNPLVERVDPNHRSGLGVIALATQTEANVDKGKNPNKEVAITPETLANRTATETRQGILRTATEKEVLIDSTATHDKLIAITPFTLNKRTPTEQRSGVVIIANQAEVNAGAIDDKFVSPLKLHNRTATESRTGIAALVKSGGTPTTVSRGTKGTMVYDFSDHKTIVTPKTLTELKSTALAAGLVFIANENEVISGSSQDPIKFPAVVSPEELHKKTATEERIGFTQTATQEETNTNVDGFKYVSPKTLSGRTATVSRTGIAKLATQKEFDDGHTLTISTPSVVKARFKSATRYNADTSSGVSIDGSLWDTLNVKNLHSSLTQIGTISTASGDETNKRLIDNKAVTPKSLASVVSSETNSGLVRLSTLNELITGADNTLAVSPLNLFTVKNHKTAWKADTKTFGFIRLATLAETWVGNNKVGSTTELSLYDELNAVSPKGLNNALLNYLPKTATAVNSDKLGNRAPSEYTVKSLNEIVAGKWIFNNLQTFKTGVNVTGPSTLDTISLNGVSPQLEIKPTSNAVESSISLKTKTGDSWNLSTFDNDITLSSNDKTVAKFTKDGILDLQNGVISNTSQVDLANKLTLNNWDFIEKDSTTGASIGNTAINVKMKSLDASNLVVSEKSASYKIVTTKNLIEETGKNFLNTKGGTLTGRLDITNNPVSPLVKETAAATSVQDIGIWNQNILLAVNTETYPPVSGDRTVVDGSVVYKNPVYGPGVLFNTASSRSNGFQIWAPSGSSKKYIRSTNANGTYGEFDEILTMNNLPTPEEIGAISSSGLVYKDLKVQGWIQIGPLRIRPNLETKEVEFDWIED